jgi:protein phosphatase
MIALKAKDVAPRRRGASDLGCSRKNNEDSFGVFQLRKGAALLVCDGMGGAAAGEVASRLAVEAVGETYEQAKERGHARDALTRALKAANRSVHEQAAGDSRREGMGTTCTAAAIVGLELVLGHVGDSRAYLVRGGAIEQMTQDHTLAGELERVAGTRGVAVPEAESRADALYRRQPDVGSTSRHRSSRTARIVLCSDGLATSSSPPRSSRACSPTRRRRRARRWSTWPVPAAARTTSRSWWRSCARTDRTRAPPEFRWRRPAGWGRL